MKKLVFSLAAVAFCGLFAQAQVSGTVSGTVVDAQQQPVPGVAVFFLGSHTTWNNSVPVSAAYNFTYTDGTGNYTISYHGITMNDSAVIGVMDCNKNVVARPIQIYQASMNPTNHNIQVSCVPDECDVFVTSDSISLSSHYIFTAVALRDSAFSLQGPAVSPIIHEWEVDNVIYTSPVHWTNEDSIMIPQANLPSKFQYCYQRTALCAPTCDTKGNYVPPTPFCDAHFYVDTVNSINFQGQIVMWENSSVTSGNITDYHWTFGDGNSSNVQYPTHTYNDTGVYEICLKITAVDAGDTCVSTYCDSVGFDSNGNLYKSTGFTINVVDPATVGQAENSLKNQFSLYPNPSHEKATLSWEGAVLVETVNVISMSGQLVKSIAPGANLIEISGLEKGAYILRIQSREGVASMKLIVE